MARHSLIVPEKVATSQAKTTISTALSCRRLWKVYGPGGERRFRELSMLAPDTDRLRDSLRAENLIVAAADVGFEVWSGEIFVVMGLSGSGKSTVVRCLSRLIEPTAGEVLIDSADILKFSEKELITLRRRKLGMVFQNFGLLPHLNVIDNVAYPLRVQGMARLERESRARGMIDLVGLKGRERSFPKELSGGMQQRVGIARSLAVEPDIWLLDEPFSALDPLIRRQMQDEFMRLQSLLRKTIVFITHDFLEALRLADRIAIMREGSIVQIGTPADLVLRPADGYVSEFTRDVPRAKVLTVADIAGPLSSSLDTANVIPGNTILHDAMKLIAGRNQALAVQDRNGEIIGQVDANRVLAAIAQT
jgi:glycine betaine/proline transport system ATP-binding protein